MEIGSFICEIQTNFYRFITCNYLAIGCRADSDCPGKQSCVNGRCDEPAAPKEPVPVVGECPPCKAHEECDQATLTCFPGKFLFTYLHLFGLVNIIHCARSRFCLKNDQLSRKIGLHDTINSVELWNTNQSMVYLSI